ncbi:sigma E protease regulator RseP [Neptuniibacter sp. QD48_11]|uniref:sigma E protease regulator RseP n=1 Tax=unclassified Neptuniibacter TaxID=2630693 RepID=UPI0039F4F2EB
MELLHTILATIVTLGILVTIHEWGHFYVARRCGVKVLRFSVGFGKAFYTWKDRQGTEYAIASIPLGGYVKMLDEREGDVPEEQLSQAFNRKPVIQRIAIVAAGPLVNLVFAVFAYWFLFIYGVSAVVPVIGGVQQGSLAESAGLPIDSEIVAVDGYETLSWDAVNLRLASRVAESGVLTLKLREEGTTLLQEYRIALDEWTFDLDKQSPVSALGLVPWRPYVPAIFGSFLEDGRAVGSGLKAGDEVLSVNGVQVQDWLSFVGVVKANPENELNLKIDRSGQEFFIKLTPALKITADGEKIGYIGAGTQQVSLPENMERQIRYGPIESIFMAFERSWQLIGLIFDSIWKMLTGDMSVKNLSGPITIAKVAGSSASLGVEYYIGFLAYLSISLGILNLLPIPVLDGGHLLYYAVELVTGRPVSENIQLLGLKIGMAMLLSLMFVALFNDFMRL